MSILPRKREVCRSRRQFLSRVVACAVVTLASADALGEAWVLNAPVWSRSYAKAQVPRTAAVIDDSGVQFAQTTATAGPITHGRATAYAHGHSRGLWGGTVAVAATYGGSAGSIAEVTDRGDGDLDYDAEFIPGSMTLSGTSSSSLSDNSLELSVLDVSAMTENEVSDIFLVYGSVEAAVDAGYLASERVLFTADEETLTTIFQYVVDTGTLVENDLLVSGMGHAVSDEVPTVSEWGLAIMTLIGLAGGSIVFARRRVRGAAGAV